MVLRVAVAVHVDGRLGPNRQGGLLEEAVRVLIEGLQGPVEARPVLGIAVLIHVSYDRPGEGDARELRMTVVARVGREGGDLQGLPDLEDAVRIRVRAAVQIDPAVDSLRESVRVRVRG